MKPSDIFPIPSGLIAATGLLFSASGPASATIYDLAADWSDSANPHGPWSYNEGANPLPHVSAWQGLSGDFTTAQPAWARGPVGNTNLPCWFKSSATVGVAHDWQTGDVITHSTDGFNGVGSGPANVTWACPGNGAVNISGAVWMGRDIGRGNHWTLSINSTALSGGDVFSGDISSRASPFNFTNGSGGAAVLANLSVSTGDTFKLQLDKTSSPGDYTGVNFTIVFTPAFMLRITDVDKLTNDLRLTFTSQAGSNYAIQARTNLVNDPWLTLAGTTNLAAGSLLQTTLTNAFTRPQRFFRVEQLP